MEFATKKECADLLAFLAEENWSIAKIQRKGCPFSQVSWVDYRIVTVRQVGEHLLLRVSAVLKGGQDETVERLFEAGAMREAGDYCYSTKRACGFLLAEATVYVQLTVGKKNLAKECQTLYVNLNQLLGYSP